MTNFRSLREPWKIGDYRLFGDILPFIGFETIEADTKEVIDAYDIDLAWDIGPKVLGTFFTMEWLGKGVSLGGFNVPIKKD